MGELDRPGRADAVTRALRLEYFTVGWNAVEALIAVAAAIAVRSVALMAFGIDSVVEGASGAVLMWRLMAERRGMDATAVERLDRRAHRMVGGSLFLLVLYVAADAAIALVRRERPETSGIGIALMLVSIVVMFVLGRAKRRVAAQLRSPALASDAFQTSACMWLSAIALVGLGLNATLGWWWADPVAALVMCVPIVQEGVEAWRGECGCDPYAHLLDTAAPTTDSAPPTS